MTGIRCSQQSFGSILAQSGTESVKLPPRSPNLNSYAERFVRTIKESCLERMILFGEDALRTAVKQFMAHYHGERNHQGIGNPEPFPDPDLAGRDGVRIRCRSRPRWDAPTTFDRAAWMTPGGSVFG